VKIIYWLGRGEGSTSDEAVGDHAGLLIGTATPTGETDLGLQLQLCLFLLSSSIINGCKLCTIGPKSSSSLLESIFGHAGVVVA
jgi:hypothetical protein